MRGRSFWGPSGAWVTPGGDFRNSECKLPTAGTEDTEVVFDIADWTQERVIGLQENFGFVLISQESEFEVKGDRVLGSSPEFVYTILR